MKPLGGVCAGEAFERIGDLLGGPIEGRVAFGSRETNGPVHRDLVVAVTQSGGKDRENWGSREHRQSQRPFGHLRKLTEETDSAPANPARDPVDLHRNCAPIA
jgi:hypothetical protein